jgi:hypothetical protein
MLKTTFNAQGSRLIIKALQVGVLKIYVVIMEALAYLKKNERQGEIQFTTKTEVPPPLNVILFYFFESHPIYDET